MTEIISVESQRLILRQWKSTDRPQFAKLNADPVVMKYFHEVLSEHKSNLLADKIETLIADKGWGFWAVEIKETAKFIGFVGLNEPTYKLPVTPCVEIGWRLAREYWGQGYATEAANASLLVAFEQLSLNEVYSFTATSNKPSQAVMERLNMINIDKNFNHPQLPPGSPLCEHLLYKIEKQHYLSR